MVLRISFEKGILFRMNTYFNGCLIAILIVYITMFKRRIRLLKYLIFSSNVKCSVCDPDPEAEEHMLLQDKWRAYALHVGSVPLNVAVGVRDTSYNYLEQSAVS